MGGFDGHARNCKSSREAKRSIRGRRVALCALSLVLLAAALPAQGKQDGEIRFVALGDTGTGGKSQAAVAGAMAAYCKRKGCDFGLLLGDVIYEQGAKSATDIQFANKFQRPFFRLPEPGFAEGFKFYVSLGNHDNYGVGYPAQGRYYAAYAKSHPRFDFEGEYYAFDRGSATFLALGTQLFMEGLKYSSKPAGGGNPWDGQAKFFPLRIEQSKKTWRIAFGHHPYLSSGVHGNAGNYNGQGLGKAFEKFFRGALCGKIDLYLAGHDHDMEVLQRPKDCPVLQVVAGSGAKLRDFARENPRYFKRKDYGFAYLRLTKTEMRLSMVTSDGKERFCLAMTKGGAPRVQKPPCPLPNL